VSQVLNPSYFQGPEGEETRKSLVIYHLTFIIWSFEGADIAILTGPNETKKHPSLLFQNDHMIDVK
jgi:hypothetical protein